MKPLLILLLLAAPALGAESSMVHHAPPPPPIRWWQPVEPQPIEYPTPLRNFLFGRTRMVPSGPPIPFRWEPGRWVPIQEVPQ